MPLIVATVAADKPAIMRLLDTMLRFGHAQVEWDCATKGYAMNDLLIIDMRHVRAAAFYLLISVFVFVGMPVCAPEDLGSWPAALAVGAFWLFCSAPPAALVYIMAAPGQPDMVDFYRMYRP